MIKPQYILTEEEYNDLVNTEPNVFLQQRVHELEDELAKYKLYKRNMEVESDELAQTVLTQDDLTSINPVYTPLIISDNELQITDTAAFVQMYNWVASNGGKSLTVADDLLYIELSRLASMFDCTVPFESKSEVKRCRVQLQKDNLISNSIKSGVVKLTLNSN